MAFVNAIGNVSQVFTSYLYNDKEAPRYVLAMSVNAAFALVAILTAASMRIILSRANKKLDSHAANVNSVMHGESQAQVSGVTEEQARALKEGFRYIC